MTTAQWERVKEIAADAFEIELSARAAFVDSASRDAEVKQEVMRLLADGETSGVDFLSRPPISLYRLLDARFPLASCFTPGEQAGRFRIDRFLGVGGMGEVYAATDLELQESVALKTIRPAIASSPKVIERFKREVKETRRITHPNVCRVYDLFSLNNGLADPVWFLTMELLEGQTLKEALAARGTFSLSSAMPLIEDMVAALAAAHAIGLVHRDFKPANVMLVAGPTRERAVVSDFGLALDLGKAESAPVRAAASGTPAYMAPEQSAGSQIGFGADQFALGLVICEMLTGRRPPVECTSASDSGRQLDHWLRSRGELPPRVRVAMRRLLAYSPEGRFVNVTDVISLLEGSSRRRVLVASVAMAVVGAGGALWWKSRLAPRIDPEADAMFQKGRLHARRLTVEDLQKAVAYFKQAVGRQSDFALAYAGLADAYSSLNDYGGMPHRQAIDSALDAARKSVALAPTLVEAQSALALALSNDVRNWRSAETSFQKAIEINAEYGPAHQGYAAWLARLQRTAKAIAEMKLAVAADPVSLPISVVLGWMYFFDRQYGESLAQGLRTVDLDPNFRYGYLLVARSYASLGKFREGIAACQRGVQLSGNASVFASAMACIKAAEGDIAFAAATARELEQRRTKENFASSHIASIYAMVSKNDHAFRWLYNGFNDADCTVLLVRAYPQYDLIRSDARYPKLLADFSLT